jgi:cytochrome P450
VTDSELFSPLSAEMLRDPYPIYAKLREANPVHWHDQLSAWVVTSYADCVAILQDPKVFCSDFRIIGDPTPDEFLSLQTLDPPTHSDVRKIILTALRAVDVPRWAAETRQIGDKLLSELDPRHMDFVTGFVEPLAALSMCTLFGIPLLEDPAGFRSAQRDLVFSMDSGLDPDRLDAGMLARRELSKIIEPWSTSPPETGFLSKVDFAGAGELLPYLVNSLRAIFVAGYSSTSSMLGNAVRTLSAHRILDDPEPFVCTTTAFHELVRYDGAVQAESRVVAADTTLPSGGRVNRGDIVVLVVASANRDARAFTEPDRLVLDRDPNPHLGFGRGNHSCVGTRLALTIGVTLLTEMSARYRVTLDGDPVQRPTGTLRGLDHLPVSLRAR